MALGTRIQCGVGGELWVTQACGKEAVSMLGTRVLGTRVGARHAAGLSWCLLAFP